MMSPPETARAPLGFSLTTLTWSRARVTILSHSRGRGIRAGVPVFDALLIGHITQAGDALFLFGFELPALELE